MKIYIVNGAPGAGKTTFEVAATKLIGLEHCKILSTVDFVKEIAYECGWDGTKTDKNRKFLSDLKDLLTRWDNIPYQKIEQMVQLYKMSPMSPWCIFIDCREPSEIDKLCRGLNAKSIIIRNSKAEQQPTSNHADENVLNYNYTYEIDNNGSLEDLYLVTEAFLENEGIPMRIE